ncbi:MAG: lipopolysaccharide biosynthesis protein [Prevotella sp.]|nr:lipopolysaccharide biosynthesis protein [Bacteroides sp.]MCM1366975.1 lipopolysaccharide biosynthesis protein [Prevotella sp.]MCM1437484.1 lipopolysaccharide biosynthesis protein [Prevotella sp.]
MPESQLKLKTARTLKWNAIDKVASQLLYAVVGIVLANVLSENDFGLVGALLVFQAFAILFVDSGFGTALLQKKTPTQADYSTVFWFNLGVSIAVYIVLCAGAPLIADIFQGDKRLIPLSRVMFLTFVLNGLGIVQTNVLMKRMDVKQVAVANVLGLLVSGVLGVTLALTGYGVWSLVWQYVSLAGVKTAWLWVRGDWRPSAVFSKESLTEALPIGSSVFGSQLLNTASLHAYTFIIGAFYSLSSLGVYTQADKWSKMGSASLSQILTASFIPLLSKVQDSIEDWRRYIKRIDRFTVFMLFPSLTGLALIGTPLFHTLFGTKWDAAIPLFQILCVRGILVVLISLFNNYLTAAGKAKHLIIVEAVKDVSILAAILLTVGYGSLSLLVWGQLWASVLTFIIVLVITGKNVGYGSEEILKDFLPFLLPTFVMTLVCLLVLQLGISAPLQLVAELIIGFAAYYGCAKIMRLPELREASEYLLGRFRKR